MLRLPARRVIGEQGEAGELRPPGADPLGQRVEELLHRGGTVETHHLRDKREHFGGGAADGAPAEGDSKTAEPEALRELPSSAGNRFWLLWGILSAQAVGGDQPGRCCS